MFYLKFRLIFSPISDILYCYQKNLHGVNEMKLFLFLAWIFVFCLLVYADPGNKKVVKNELDVLPIG